MGADAMEPPNEPIPLRSPPVIRGDPSRLVMTVQSRNGRSRQAPPQETILPQPFAIINPVRDRRQSAISRADPSGGILQRFRARRGPLVSGAVPPTRACTPCRRFHSMFLSEGDQPAGPHQLFSAPPS